MQSIFPISKLFLSILLSTKLFGDITYYMASYTTIKLLELSIALPCRVERATTGTAMFNNEKVSE